MKVFIFVVCLCVALVIIGLAVLSEQVNAPGAELIEYEPPPEVSLPDLTERFPAPDLADDVVMSPIPEPPAGEEISPVPEPPDDDIPPDPESDYTEDEEPSIITQEQEELFELPVNGATGWAARVLPLRRTPESVSDVITNLAPGQGFTILHERGNWWNIQLSGGMSGWVEHSSCFINLPDVIPSIIYDITNSYSSIKRSSGYDIPSITGQALYEAWAYNNRLGKYEFIVPSMYEMSKRVSEMQRAALADGNTIIIFEAFRPHETQQNVYRSLTDLMAANEVVRNAINTPPWSIGAFIATSLSNHQRAAAIDASLARIISHNERTIGNYTFTHIVEYEEYEMPSAMHELSPWAVMNSSTATTGATLLRGYFINQGFTSVSSEWWHFNEPTSISIATRFGISGAFFIDTIYSVLPV